MLKGEIKSIAKVWELVEAGETVYWSNKSYKIYVTEDNSPESTANYAPRKLIEKNGKLLECRCISNYFGSILGESELCQLFTKES